MGAQLITKQLVGAFVGAGGGSLPTFAFGGVGNFGAGSTAILHGNEAVVPLPDGRSIPVTMRTMGNAPVNVPITINVANQVPNTEVKTQRSTGADGRQQIDMMIIQTVKSGVDNGTFDKNMQRFNIKPHPFQR